MDGSFLQSNYEAKKMPAASALSPRKTYLVSSCLLGLRTRYDGQVKIDAVCRSALAGAIIIPVCPEQLGGLPTPRIAAEIIGGDGTHVLAGKAQVITHDNRDVSAEFILGARQVLLIAKLQKVDGVFLRAASPSCGCGKILGVTAALLTENGYKIREF